MAESTPRPAAQAGKTTSGWNTSGSRPRGSGCWGPPTYKPEFWDKIQELDQWTNKYDPVMTCMPLGLPRHGTPRRIVQTDKDVIFFYPINADYGGGNNEYRDIPTDGRALTEAAAEPHDVLWAKRRTLGRGYARHRLHQLRRFDVVGTRRLHPLHQHAHHRESSRASEMSSDYDMTIEDPEMFLEPWVMPTRVLPLDVRRRRSGRSARIAKCTKRATSRVRFDTENCRARQLESHWRHRVCKRRGLYPSCGARRMAETAALVVDDVVPR